MSPGGAGEASEDVSVSSSTVNRHLIRSRIGDTLVGIEAQHVQEIDDLSGVGHRDLDVPIDLAEMLDLPTPGGGLLRRVLVLNIGGRTTGLVVGDTVRIEAIPRGELRPLPPFLAAIELRTGIRQISLDRGEIGFVIDASTLSSRLREER